MNSLKNIKIKIANDFNENKKLVNCNHCIDGIIDFVVFPKETSKSDLREEMKAVYYSDASSEINVCLFCVYDDYIRISVRNFFDSYFINEINNIIKKYHPISYSSRIKNKSEIDEYIMSFVRKYMQDVFLKILGDTGYRVLNSHLLEIPRTEENKKLITRILLESGNIDRL